MKLRWIPGPRGLGVGEVYALLGAAAVLAARFFPFDRYPVLPACPLRTWTGVPCFSCGFTRAFVRTAHLELAGAWHASPLGTVLFLTLVLFVLAAAVRWATGAPWPQPVLSRREGWIVRIFVIVVLFGNWAYLLVHRFVVGDWS